MDLPMIIIIPAVFIILLVFLFLLVGYAGFSMVIRRGGEVDFSNKASLQGTPWGLYEKEISKGIGWIESQKREKITIQSFDGLTLCARLIKNPKAKGVALMFHGYKTHPEIDFSVDSKEYYYCGYHLVQIDQRASGESQGSFIGFGVLESKDCLSWCQYVAERFGPDMPIVMAGLSMGGTTVLRAIGEGLPPSVKGIIADSAFSSPSEVIKRTIKRRYGIPGGPITRLINFWTKLMAGYSLYVPRMEKIVINNHIPIFLIHGKQDDLVPVEMTIKTYEANPGPKDILISEEATHGTSYLVETEKYRNMLVDFLNRV